MSEGWQPIETAPRDGTTVLTYARTGDIGIESYKDGGWGLRQLVKRLHRHDDNAVDYKDEPTHWMPLPEPPVTAREDR